MALRALKRAFVVTLQNFVPVLRIGARPFNLTLQFLLHPVRTLFLSSVAYRPLEHSKLAFRHYEPMEIEGRIVVYSILGCPHCMKAKNTLQELGLPYDDVRLDIFPKSVREEVQKRTGKTSVPQIFFNATLVGGNDDFQKLVEDKARLNALIEEVRTHAPPPDAPVPPDPTTATESADPGNFVCEPDEYAKLVQELKASGLVKDHRKGLTVYKSTFCGKEFVNWIVQNKQLDRDRAVEMGQQLIDRHFGHNVKADQEVFRDDQVYYRLLEDDDTAALNGGDITACEPQPASVIGSDLRKMILKLYGAFLSKDGKAVDYKAIGGSTEFKAYVGLTKQLQRVKIVEASHEEKLAFFINVYNALVIHANIVLGPPVNLWQRYKFFNTVKYIIGGNEYSLQDMENGVLRANRKGVGMFTRPFSKSDPRLKVALETHEPLIHFGLVCGAKSCPPIKTYTPEEVIEQLTLACQAFLDGSDGCEIDMPKKTIKLSMIFKWYQEDFGRNSDEVAQWVHANMADGEKKQQLGELLAGKKYKVTHMKYDWSVNSK